MEATVLSVGRSVVDGAVSYAKSALAEEVALQLGVQRDQAFISDELEMMQSFLMAAHNEPDEHKVLKTWVKQVRDAAYDVEDCLQDFAVRLETRPPWWRLPCTLRERRRIASQMKELRARVEDVSKRNLRYHLIKGPASSGKPTTTATEQPSGGGGAGATMFGIHEARRATAKHDKPKVDLIQLISKEEKDLRVIAMWGTGGDLGQTSTIKRAYDDIKIRDKFECRAWIRLMHPFNPTDFLQGIVRQFYVSSLQDQAGETQEKATPGAQVLKKMATMKQEDLVDEFSEHVHEKSYLVVLNDLWTIEDWDWIKTYFPNNKKGSRIVVSTHLVEVASLCAGQDSQVSELQQLSADQTLYVFYEEGSQVGTASTKPGSSSNVATTSANSSTVPAGEILGDKSKSADGKNVVRKNMSLTRIRSMQAALKESPLIGRPKERSDIIELISNQASQKTQVITVWGMGGLGKTTLVQDVYQSQELSSKFEKRAFVTVMHPFNREELLRGLVKQLDAEPSEKKNVTNLGMAKKLALKEVEGLITKFVAEHKCLIVLDDVSSIVVWDMIIPSFRKMNEASKIIVTTREENIAKHCSKEQENIYKVKGLKYEDAQDIFTKKVFKKTVNLGEQYPELVKEAELILKKCNGLPLALVTIGGFLANQPKTAVEWRKLNEHISAELEMNPELETIRTVLTESYDGLPYHLKSCFLYLSIFPEDHKVSRRRLVRRWTAEGYSRDIRDKSAKEIADGYFMELIQRSMILPSQQPTHSRKGIDSCQVHDLIHEIGISKSMEENLVFRLEEGCNLNSRVTVRHLAVSNWEGDQSEFESTVDMSRIRSLTVFGKWRTFFISDKMRLLRVLDLEDTSGLVNHHLEQIGKLLNLRYLSLRECGDIFHLPDSVGNLRQLQTLDIAGTSIIKLPRTIIKLRKLQYIRAGGVGSDDADSFEELHVPKLVRNKLCLSTFVSVGCCVACCSPQLLKGMFGMVGDPNRRDVCTTCCYAVFPFYVARQSPHGVQMPRGIHRLQALHTLGIVNAAQGKAVLQDIRRLPWLRKLGVTGINKKNGQELCSAIASLSRLESLLLRSEGQPGLHGCLDGLSSPPPENLQSLEGEPGLHGCLDGLSSPPPENLQSPSSPPPENLQSLKLYGNLVILPKWIQGLQNLVKLSLRSTRISDLSGTIQVLGKLPNLTILRLWRGSFQSNELHFNFQKGTFLSLMLLHLDSLDNLKTVKFEGGAMPKLELLQFCGWTAETNTGLLSGLPSLPSLKEVMLYGDYMDDFMKDLRAQLEKNVNRPVLKRYNS